MDLVTSMKALNKTVEAAQLTSDLGGSFTYSHAGWLQFHQVPVCPSAQPAWGFSSPLVHTQVQLILC